MNEGGHSSTNAAGSSATMEPDLEWGIRSITKSLTVILRQLAAVVEQVIGPPLQQAPHQPGDDGTPERQPDNVTVFGPSARCPRR